MADARAPVRGRSPPVHAAGQRRVHADAKVSRPSGRAQLPAADNTLAVIDNSARPLGTLQAYRASAARLVAARPLDGTAPPSQGFCSR